MLKTIIEKEIRDYLGSPRFAVTFAVSALLILFAFYVGVSNFKSNRARYEAAKAENMRQFEGMTDWFNIQQHRIFLPPHPLEALVSGISNDIGRTTEVRGRGELVAIDSRYSEEPIFAVFRFLDLSFIYQIVLSLFAILLGYNAVSGEKERGTLRLSFSNAIPRAVYILGKLIGAFLALAVPLCLAIAIGSLLLPLLGVPMAGEDWLRLSLIHLSGLLYFGAFLTLSVMISTFTQRTSNSFLLLLVIWILVVLIVPRASVLIAGRAVDVISAEEVAAKKRSFRSQLWKEHFNNLDDFKPSNTEAPDQMMDKFNRFMEERADERDKKMAELAGRLNEERFNGQLRQQKLALSLARISPVSSLALATSVLAGTSLHQKEHYHDEATAYQKTYAQFIKEKTGTNPGGRMIMIQMTSDDDEKPEAIDPTELPAFTYRPTGLSQSVEAAVVDMGILLLFNLIFFAGAFVGFLRYDLR